MFLVAALLAFCLLSAPGAYDSPLGGTPFDIPGYSVAGAILCLALTPVFFPRRARVGVWLPLALLALLAVKVGVGRGDVPPGWRASYRHADTKGQMVDGRVYWRFASRPDRLEPAIALWATRSDLHFLNDVDLYGYPPYDATPRERLYALDVTWTGHVTTVPGQRLIWTVTAAGTVTVPGAAGPQVLENPAGVQVELPALPPGQHPLTVRFAKPPGTDPAIRVRLTDAATGRSVPVAADPAPLPATAWRATATTAVVVGGVILLALTLVAGYVRAGTGRDADGLITSAAGLAVTIALVGWGVVLATRAHGSTAMFGAGGDPLYYGSSARDILHHGLLMLHGAPLGQASPYYFYPMYPYMLAGAHALVGDNVSAIYLLNGCLVALLPALFQALGWSRLRAVAGTVAFAALGVFVVRYGGLVITFDQPSFTDIAYLTLVFVTLAAMARAFDGWRPGWLVLAGVCMAFGAATRPSLMTLVYLAPFGLLATKGPRSWRAWAIASACFAAGVALGLAPFTLRNGIAAGKFVVLVNSWIQIPYFLIPPEIPEKPGGMPGLLQAVGMAWEIFKEFPTRTVITEARKVLYTLGVTAVGPPGMLQANALAALPVLFGAALYLRRLAGPTAIAVSTFAVSHVLAMFIAAPWTFHYKSIVPLHAAFLFGAAFLLQRPAVAVTAASGSPTGRETPA